MTRSTKLGLLALIAAAATIWLLPSASVGREADLRKVEEGLKSATQRVGDSVEQAVAPTREKLQTTKSKTKAALDKSKRATQSAGTRQTATDPQTQPPLHGSNPHGQGSVAVTDTNPRNDRPLAGDPTGAQSGEEVVVGRARGEEQADGSYRGHITILALFGNEISGVNTNPGETRNGPVEPIQTGVLDPLCTSTNQNVCLSVLTADSVTTASGSTNDFAVARARVANVGVGAAESNGTIAETQDCQTAVGTARAANVVSSGGVTAQAATSTVSSQSCRGQAPTVTPAGSVINLFGVQVPIPAPGCAAGTPDTVTGVPNVLPIVCNAQEIAGAAIVREALSVYVLSTGPTSLVKETTAAAEAISAAPEAGTQCTDGVDNDGDGLIDFGSDPGCESPQDDDERDRAGVATRQLPRTGGPAVPPLLGLGLLGLAGAAEARRRRAVSG